MTYFDTTRVKQDLQLSDPTYDSQINGTWGPAADSRIDNKLAGFMTVPLAVVPDLIRDIANMYVQYRYYKSIHNEKATAEAKAEFDSMMADYILVLQRSTNLIIRSQSYRTYPLNPDATPYMSTSGGNNSIDDSDL